MKENVSLVKRKQKVFSSSVDKYKKLLKKGEIKVQEKPVAKKVTKINERGIVYVGNIPHGFYENQIMNYFKQFGKVSRIRLARSKKTGRSKGYAFVEFKEPEVAKIVAETMNNYLMGKRLLKAQYITPESRQNKDYFKGKNFTADKYPALANRKNNKISLNTFITEDKMKEKNQNAVKAIYKMQKKLKSLDIHYDFKPVDVPSYLIEEIQLLQNSKNENLNSTENSSDPELSSSQESSDDIVFTPPEQLTKTIKNKINPKKQKLVGIVKKTKKSAAKPATIKDKKASLIKKQIIGKDQIKIKSPKKKKIGK